MREQRPVAVFLLLTCLVAAPGSARAQTGAASAPIDPEARAEAYRLFLVGRHLDGVDDVDGAIQAYRDASELDPEGGEILGELASLYARRNQISEATDTARDALRRAPDNLTAHRILGLVFAARAGARGGTSSDVDEAIEHLTAARGTILPDLQVELTLARLYVSQDRNDDAIELLEALLEDEIGLVEGALLLAEAYEEEGRSQDAVQVLEQAIFTGRPSTRALRRLGDLYGRMDRWDDAVQAYELAVARNPRSSGAQRDLASALLRNGQLEAGRDVLQRLTENRPDDGAALYRLSEVELELGNLDAAEGAARRLMEAEPNGIRGPYALSEVQNRRHDYQGVVETLEPAIQTARDGNLASNQVASLLGRLGFAQERLQDYGGAAETYRQAAELMPTSLAFGARLVQAYLEVPNADGARSALERIQPQYPANLTLMGLQARVLAQEGDTDAGVAVLERAVRERPEEPRAYLVLAGFLADEDRFDAAAQYLRDASTRFPDNETVLFQLGSIYERSRRYDEAEEAFRAILERDPDHAATLNYLGYMLADQGRQLEESVQLLERAIEIDPHNGAYLDSLGWAYFKLDRLELAETHLRQASEQMVWNSVIQDHLGDLLFRLGRFDEAIEAWETALAGDGEEVESSAIQQKMDDARSRMGRD